MQKLYINYLIFNVYNFLIRFGIIKLILNKKTFINFSTFINYENFEFAFFY